MRAFALLVTLVLALAVWLGPLTAVLMLAGAVTALVVFTVVLGAWAAFLRWISAR